MSAPGKTFAFGTLGENGDTWFLLGDGHMTLLDAPFAIDLSLEEKEVSVIGEMGVPASAPGITKLIVDALVSHEAVAQRAYEIFQSEDSGSAEQNWVRAERELLGM